LGKCGTEEVSLEFRFERAEAGQASDGGWERIEKCSCVRPRKENDLSPYDVKRAWGTRREVVLENLNDLAGV
jgi:hypothetical protein